MKLKSFSLNYGGKEINIFFEGKLDHVLQLLSQLVKSPSWCSFTKGFKTFSIQDINEAGRNLLLLIDH